ncbi:ester cyclase [Reyranella sp. MMS21-HV4-11]|uniref:Ester cyclase n=1 Tax=Reyranella humidisoli TaxID=2849149 RepID=A0ABS6IKW1_9HYPH|nr:ester cyclase [Reyranella sp. MMS21-HV4-11]
MDPKLAELAQHHLVAENNQDLEATLATLHPECRFDDLATGQTWHGRDGAAAHYRQWWTTFDVEVKRGPGQVSAWTADNVCMAEATWHGRHIGRFLGIEPTGRTIVQPFVVVLGFRDGLMVSERFHYDLGALLRQIGGPSVPALDELPYRQAA